jgi:aldehyde dehydrogenase (NAD+)
MSTVTKAIDAAVAATKPLATLPAHVRAGALDYISQQISLRGKEFADVIAAETGKPAKWAQAEVSRAVSTFRWAAEEARRNSGELQRLDTDATATGRLALIKRVARGPVLGITPFNFPLNLVAHKVAPAIAAGAPIIIKPAPATPKTAHLLAEVIAQTDLPVGAFAVVDVPNDEAAALASDPRLPVISFTGSGPVGHAIKKANPLKHVTLELGGNAAAYVHSDWPDLDWAADRLVTFATYQGGQSCISVQRVFVHRDIFAAVQEKILARIAKLDPTEDVGPLINEAAAVRVSEWITEAAEQGAMILAGGMRDGRYVPPTVLANVPLAAKVNTEEVFGPVLTLTPVDSAEDAFARINASKFGLQAGVFTKDLPLAFQASADLEVGGVIIGDVPSFRADQMPYGGQKQSGTGREGIRSAIADLTEERVLVLTGILI